MWYYVLESTLTPKKKGGDSTLIRGFALNAVEITEPVFVNAFEKEQEYLRSIETDRLLAGFRETAGLEKKTDRYTGGWENAEISGHMLGHYMTALAQLYTTTEAEDYRERLEYILDELSECQAKNGYLFTFGEEIFDRLENGGLVWMPWCTMHKILSGLISVYQLTKIPQALSIAMKLGNWICERVLNWTETAQSNVRCIADGGMNDCLYELYKETGRKAFAEAAAKFDELEMYEQLLDGKDVLRDRHANYTIPKFLGALNRYMALGESEKLYLDAAQTFFEVVIKEHIYVTGGNGERECFRMAGELAASHTLCSCETCSAYNLLKLAERLYAVTGEKRYMDYYERTFLNGFDTPFHKFRCCTGMCTESITKLNHAIYHTAEDILYVNLYIASVLRSEELGLLLTQTVDIERFDSVSLAMKLDAPKKFTLCLRLPEWSEGDVEVKVNGVVPEYTVKDGYVLLEGNWKNGDQVEYTLSPKPALHPLPDAAKKVSERSLKRNRPRGSGGVGKVLAWIFGIVLAVVLLYLFAIPISKGLITAKDAVDAFLADKFPKAAEVLGIQGDDDVVPVVKDTPAALYLVEDAEGFVANTVFPEGYQASVVRLNGKQYICMEGNGLKVYYLNEVADNESKHVYLEKGTQKALYFWDYSFDNAEILCPVNGVFNTSEEDQYVFYTDAAKSGIHVLDATTLEQCKLIPYEETVTRLLDVGAYTEGEENVRVDMTVAGVEYSFLVPKEAGAFKLEEYVVQLDGLGYTTTEEGVRFDAYVVSASSYLGKVVGRMNYSNQAYVLNQLNFYAYAEEEFGNVTEDPVIPATTLESAERERVAVVGDRGERLLIPVREDVKRYEYKEEAFLREDNGEIRYVQEGKTVSVKGIDVSKYQEKIDWEKVAASGVEYAMIRLGFRGMGTNGTCELDTYYERNVQGALDAGIEVGVYFFSQATTVEEAKEEAQFVLEHMKDYDITWPVAYDTEEITSYEAARANSISREDRTACAKAFMEEIAAAGYTPVLYANTRWSILKLDMGQLAEYDLWYAYYGESPYYPYHYTMWQYTNVGEIPGINGSADVNISFVDYGAAKEQEQ